MKAAYGFGVRPQLRQNHFFVVKPGALGGSFVRVYERFRWTPPGAGPSGVRDAELGPDLNPIYRDGQRIEGADTLRLELPPAKWEKVAPALAAEFNPRLRKDDLPTGRFQVGGTPVDADFGKEMMVLLWAIKEADPSQIPDAIENWKGFLPEERRWLYTTANVKWGGLGDRRGWRAGLREVFCAMPKREPRQVSVDDLFCNSPEDERVDETVPADKPSVRAVGKKPFGGYDRSGFYISIPPKGSSNWVGVFKAANDASVARVQVYIWNALVHEVENEFNPRLRADKLRMGKFGVGANGVERLLGKELTVLLWSLEDCPSSAVPTALKNWLALMPEERWWLYTQTAAAPQGWKKALKCALAECNTSVVSQAEMFEGGCYDS